MTKEQSERGSSWLQLSLCEACCFRAPGYIPYILSFTILGRVDSVPTNPLGSGTEHAASEMLAASDLVLQMLRGAVSCGNSGERERERGAPGEDNEGATLVQISVLRDKGLLYVEWYH